VPTDSTHLGWGKLPSGSPSRCSLNFGELQMPLEHLLGTDPRCKDRYHHCLGAFPGTAPSRRAAATHDRWGLDHDTGSVLRHVYPQADIPVVQLSIDETQPPSFHYEVGKRLALLREEGILILAAATSCTTCMPMLGDTTHRSRTIGRSRLKLESARCSLLESTSRS
jgi:hypothetical protein